MLIVVQFDFAGLVLYNAVEPPSENLQRLMNESREDIRKQISPRDVRRGMKEFQNRYELFQVFEQMGKVKEMWDARKK